MLSGKYKNFIINDIDGRMPELFIKACRGEYTLVSHKEWISREDYFKYKDSDAYIKTCWSFGNKDNCYIYGEKAEPYKKAMHFAVFHKDTSLFSRLGIKVSDLSDIDDPYKRYHLYRKELMDIELPEAYKRLHSLERLRRLESLERLRRLESLERLRRLECFNSLERFAGDWQDVNISENSLIYCDIPYKDTDGYGKKRFDYERFYQWARKQKNIFISEYQMPEDFEAVAQKKKRSALGNNTLVIMRTEKLFTSKETAKRLFF